MNEQLTLIAGEERRPVFCRVASIGQREYYEAQAVDIHPDCKFILADYLEYHDERLCEYNGQMYRVPAHLPHRAGAGAGCGAGLC